MITTVNDLIEALRAIPPDSKILVDLRPVGTITKDPKASSPTVYNIEPHYEKCVYCKTRVKNAGVTANGGVAHVTCWNNNNPTDKR